MIIRMKQLRWRLMYLATGLLMAAIFAQAQTPVAQRPATTSEAPEAKQTLSSEWALREARRLSQEGKFDEAIAKLVALALKEPELKGLARELGVSYYKKSAYLKAVASLKKAPEEDPGDNEGVPSVGVWCYLA